MIAGSSKRKSTDSRGGRILMATLIRRTCCRRGGTGHEVNNHAARSYALQVYGKQEWETDTRWSKEDTQTASADAWA